MRKLLAIALIGILFQMVSCRPKPSPEEVVQLTLSSNELTFKPRGNQVQEIKVTTSESSIKVRATEDWIKITQTGNILKIYCEDNLLRSPRSGEAIIYAGQFFSEVKITQEANDDFYLLPLLKFETSLEEISKFEESRGCIPIKLSESEDENDYFLGFLYPVKGVKMVHYAIDKKYSSINSITFFPESLEVFFNETFIDFLKQNGFEVEQAEAGFVAYHKESGFKAVCYELEGTPYLIFVHPIVQDKDYPSFESFPFDKTHFILNPDYPYEKIRASELADKSMIFIEEPHEYYPEFIRTLVTKTADAPNHVEYRVFFMNEKGTDEDKTPTKQLESLLCLFSDIHLAFWEYRNDYYLTKEFIALTEKAGFIYQGKYNQYQERFYHKERNLIMIAFISTPGYLDTAQQMLNLDFYDVKTFKSDSWF